LLKKLVGNMAAERAPEPDSRNDTANVRNTEEVSHHVERRTR
jgi:hypothetical protein